MRLPVTPVLASDLPIPVRVAIKRHSFVKKSDASKLTLDEIEHIVHWCGFQDGNLWEGMTLQEILNVYRISGEFDSFECMAEQEGDGARRKWNNVVRRKNRLQLVETQ